MLQKIIAAIRNFLASLFGTENNAPTEPARPGIPDEFEGLDDDFISNNLPQDGADMDTSSYEVVQVEIDPSKIELPAPEPGAEQPTGPAPQPSSNEPHKARYLWCLDNGHGRLTAGKRSPKMANGQRFMEYEFNRDIVRRVSLQLDKLGAQYLNLVPEVEIDNFLAGRVERANKKASDLPKLYVSIHANAARAQSIDHWAVPGAKGIETWFKEGDAKSQRLATIFQKHLIAETGFKNRNIKGTKGLYVIVRTKMTAILTENGFYNDMEEALELTKDAVRQRIADAHIAAIMEVEKNGL
jgi:N-acetylmuramoyl-L-alanine amidase